MSDLVSIKQVSEQSGIPEKIISDLVKSAKLKSSRLMIGADQITLFDQAEVSAITQAHIQKIREAAEQKKATEEAEKEPTMKDMMERLKVVSKDISDVAELHEEIKKLTSANQCIFKALIEFKTETQDRLAGLKTIVIGARDEVHAMKNDKQAVEKLTEPATLKSVAVIGISKVHHAALQMDYGSKIDIKLIDPSDIKGIYSLKNKTGSSNYQTVYAMRKFTDIRHTEQMKSAKISPIYIDGGLDALCNMLDGFLAANSK